MKGLLENQTMILEALNLLLLDHHVSTAEDARVMMNIAAALGRTKALVEELK